MQSATMLPVPAGQVACQGVPPCPGLMTGEAAGVLTQIADATTSPAPHEASQPDVQLSI
jgi:hypothetical protein